MRALFSFPVILLLNVGAAIWNWWGWFRWGYPGLTLVWAIFSTAVVIALILNQRFAKW